MRLDVLILAAVAAVVFVPCLPAETLEVPDDYDTIQEAIDEAVDGDVVSVAAGTYEENIDFLGKAITVESVDGPEDTIIDGQFLTLDEERGSVVSFLTEDCAVTAT